jgi:hypothetical protein
MSAYPRITAAEYHYCVRLGMTQAECAVYLGISRAAVTKAKARLHLTFGNGMTIAQGKQWEMEMYANPWERQAFVRYPIDLMAVNDWCEVNGSPWPIANRANVRLFPKRFRTVTRNGMNIVQRAA